MRPLYPDIIELAEAAGREPLWWDDHGTPRFRPFEPDLVPDVYAREAVLLLIACQGCGRRFRVSVSWGTTQRIPPLSERSPTYGDPPPHMGPSCAAGDTMSSDPIAVLEFWERRRTLRRWTRRPDLERVLEE